MVAQEIPITVEKQGFVREELLRTLAELRSLCALVLNVAEAGSPDRTLCADLLASSHVYLDACNACVLCCVRARVPHANGAKALMCEACAS